MQYDLFLSKALGKSIGECMYTATRINRLKILLLKWRSYFLIEMDITVITDLNYQCLQLHGSNVVTQMQQAKWATCMKFIVHISNFKKCLCTGEGKF